jgi:O-6-methylguanine DNA methyltransferase
MRNSTFKEKVYAIVKKIPAGKVMTYKQVAEKVGGARYSRAVGTVLHLNKDPEIPCHRVIRSDGNFGGYNRGAQEKVRKLRAEGYLPAQTGLK